MVEEQKMTSDQKIKIELCQTMKELYLERILTDVGGNLSFLSEEDDQFFWITPSGMKKNLVEPKHLLKMTMDGNVVSEDDDTNLIITERLQGQDSAAGKKRGNNLK